MFALALWLAHWLRYNLTNFQFPYFNDAITGFFPDYFWLFWVIIPIGPLLLEFQGFYKQQMVYRRAEMAWQLAKSCFWATAGLIFVLFMVHNNAPARGVLVFFGFFSFILIFIKEEAVLWAYKHEFGITHAKQRILLVGTKEDTQRLRSQMFSRQEELQICGEMDLGEASIEQMVAALHQHSINGVIISGKHTYFGKVEKAIQACELEGIEAWLVADFFNTRISRTSLDEFFGRPALVFTSGPTVSWSGVAKQFIDFLGAFVLLIAFSLVLIVVAIAIKLTSRGPILFKQQRAGINGKPFNMYKFRSMVTNAEQLKQELASLNEMSGPVFKVTNDPRVTRVGRFIRKYSLDEFPQLFNVLRGEMSLVGPRPLPVDEVNRFDDLAHRRRLSVKPGLTCLWQISGRNNLTDFKEWVRLDLNYIDNWSLWLDLKILCLTIPVVLLGKGAK